MLCGPELPGQGWGVVTEERPPLRQLYTQAMTLSPAEGQGASSNPNPSPPQHASSFFPWPPSPDSGYPSFLGHLALTGLGSVSTYPGVSKSSCPYLNWGILGLLVCQGH